MRTWLGIVAVFVLAVSCAPAPREALPEVVRMDEEERASYEVTIAALRAEVEEEVSRRVAAESATADAELGLDASAADARLAACRAEVARYKAGLERAVDQLNRQGGEASIVLPIAVPSATAARDRGKVHVFTPRVTQPHGLAVLVEWRLYSTRDSRTEATAVVRLMENGRETEVERVAVTVDGGEGSDYSVMFHVTPDMAATYTAEISLEDAV